MNISENYWTMQPLLSMQPIKTGKVKISVMKLQKENGKEKLIKDYSLMHLMTNLFKMHWKAWMITKNIKECTTPEEHGKI